MGFLGMSRQADPGSATFVMTLPSKQKAGGHLMVFHPWPAPKPVLLRCANPPSRQTLRPGRQSPGCAAARGRSQWSALFFTPLHKSRPKAGNYRRTGGDSLEISVRDAQKVVEVWLTRAERDDPAVKARLTPLYREYRRRNYTVAVFQSGSCDLFECTRDLLRYNKEKATEPASLREKDRAVSVSER